METAGLARCCLWFTLFFAGSLSADPFAGSYNGAMAGEPHELMILTDNFGNYEGFIEAAGEKLPLFARRFGERIAGQIGVPGDGFGFVAQVQGAVLILQDEDGERIVFHRHSTSGASVQEKAAAGDEQRSVYINRERLDTATLQSLESQSQLPIADGRYWYDGNTGAWGVEGGPTAGLIMPGLPLPATMPAGVSGGGTGIFINGREIHPLDQQAMHKLFGVTYQGDFWMDAVGNIGYLGGPAIANLIQASQAANSSGSSGSVTQGYDSTYGARGSVSEGMYSGRGATGQSVFWFPGM